jgi:hypothetical protein
MNAKYRVLPDVGKPGDRQDVPQLFDRLPTSVRQPASAPCQERGHALYG